MGGSFAGMLEHECLEQHKYMGGRIKATRRRLVKDGNKTELHGWRLFLLNRDELGIMQGCVPAFLSSILRPSDKRLS